MRHAVAPDEPAPDPALRLDFLPGGGASRTGAGAWGSSRPAKRHLVERSSRLGTLPGSVPGHVPVSE